MEVLIIIVIVILVIILAKYNNLVKARNKVRQAESGVDVYLNQRFDLIPNLVECVKGYSKHEKEIFTEITNLRTTYMKQPKDIKNAEKLNNKMNQIIAVAENYPELKANENFAKLSADLTKIEDEIANSRKYYNGAVRELNNEIQMFPGNIVAGVFGFKQANMFEANAEERNNVKVSL